MSRPSFRPSLWPISSPQSRRRQLNWAACAAVSAALSCRGAGDAPASVTSPSPRISEAASSPAGRDPLVIVLVVDQMRYEMLERFGPTWTGGLRRLLDEGAIFSDAHHRHATTYTAPGHASLSTGTYPRQHGIAANRWPQPPGPAHSAGAAPSARPTVPDGFAGAPEDLRRTSVGDWLREAVDEAEVWSVAMKPRAAVFLGGQHPTGVLWWEETAARHGSSSAYFPEGLPLWVGAFDAAIDFEAIASSPWTLDPDAPPVASRMDDFPAEGRAARFPHDVDEHDGSVGSWLRYHPRGDAITLQLALELIQRRQLGARGVPDLLWIGLSSGDWLGHRNGPRSVEMELYYRALDAELEGFLAHLTSTEAPIRVVLTSDHGVTDIPEWAASEGRSARRVHLRPLLAELQARLVDDGRCPDADLRLTSNRGVHVEAPALEPEARDRCLAHIAAALESMDWCEEAYPAAELEGRVPLRNSPYAKLYERGHVTGRSPEVALRLREGWILARGYDTGTGHNSPYPSDTHVPLIVWNPGRAAEARSEPVAMVDLAPTLACWLGVTPPPNLDGHAIEALCAAGSGQAGQGGPGGATM